MTNEQLQNWVDNYNFTTNSQASKEIIQVIVKSLPGHGFKFGPTDNNGYTLTISGPDINKTFVLKDDS
jgi:hypothetical protein